MTSYGDRDLGQHCRLMINEVLCIHLIAISQKILKVFIVEMSLKFTNLRLFQVYECMCVYWSYMYTDHSVYFSRKLVDSIVIFFISLFLYFALWNFYLYYQKSCDWWSISFMYNLFLSLWRVGMLHALNWYGVFSDVCCMHWKNCDKVMPYSVIVSSLVQVMAFHLAVTWTNADLLSGVNKLQIQN